MSQNPLPQCCLATNCTKAFVIMISQVKRMTAKSNLRSTTGFWLGGQSNKCEGRQTTRRLGRDNTHYGSRAGASRNCLTQLKLNIHTMPKTRTLANSDSVCVFCFALFFFFSFSPSIFTSVLRLYYSWFQTDRSKYAFILGILWHPISMCIFYLQIINNVFISIFCHNIK